MSSFLYFPFIKSKTKTKIFRTLQYSGVLILIVIALFYSSMSFYETCPAIHISGIKSSVKINDFILSKISKVLLDEKLEYKEIFLETLGSDNALKISFANSEMQNKAYKFLNFKLNNLTRNYLVSLCSIPNYPKWIRFLGWLKPKPLFLGLDLRGGIAFSLKVDMESVFLNFYDSISKDIRILLRESKTPIKSIKHSKTGTVLTFQTPENREEALKCLVLKFPLLSLKKYETQEGFELIALLSRADHEKLEKETLRQNISILDKRIGELGVSEPIIQRKGNDEILIQLPGVQDIAQAKKILIRSARLEIRLVEEMDRTNPSQNSFHSMLESYKKSNGEIIYFKPTAILTGKNIRDARSSVDPRDHQVSVKLTLDEYGKNAFRKITRENVGKRIAIILFEDGKGEIVTAPFIQGEIFGGYVQITGSMKMQEANEIALILRSGALAAPMKIIEEKTIEPTLGFDNIQKGLHSTICGVLIVVTFMILYYQLFGIFSVIGLFSNAILLTALVSILQITLTLPGIAAVALTLGVAIDSNVLINERIREELRNSSEPELAIYNGFRYAWKTILDSNLTALIVGLGLLILGSGPIRSFAIVHCLGILTSLFSSFFIVHALANSWYGRKRKILNISV